MDSINRKYYEQRIVNKFKDKDKKQSTDPNIGKDIDNTFSKIKELVKDSSIQHASTWLLDKTNWIDFEVNGEQNYPQLGKGRVINVNPGVDNIGREQRYVHMYIVLEEYKETFVGIPITNAKLEDGIPVLRNDMEVLLINPEGKKPYKEFRCNKPSVADLRNIRGFDKKRIIQDNVYTAARTIPDTYKEAISKAIVKLFTFND